ncbi:MAG: hypothetical protein ACYS5V_11420 [Planctomycetota bacterium]|jgi:predicted RNA-binding Zn-ribbon protein involved in translation (DUF1610 family)
MEQQKCLDCGWMLPVDISHCPKCGKKMANDRSRRDRRAAGDRRAGDGEYGGPERRRRERRSGPDRRRFSY